MFESKIFKIFHASKGQKTEGTKQSRTETKEKEKIEEKWTDLKTEVRVGCCGVGCCVWVAADCGVLQLVLRVGCCGVGCCRVGCCGWCCVWGAAVWAVGCCGC